MTQVLIDAHVLPRFHRPMHFTSLVIVLAAATPAVAFAESPSNGTADSSSSAVVAPVVNQEPPAPGPVVDDRSPRYRDPNARVAGIVLTTIASASLAAGSVVTLIDMFAPESRTSDVSDRGVVAVFVGVPIMATSTVLAGIGIPLVVWGSGSPTAPAAARLSLTAGSVRFACPF